MVRRTESKQTYYVLHIQYTNSEISIVLLYIRPYFVWWGRLNHCVALVRNLPTSILVRALVSLLTFDAHTSIILDPLWFTNFESCQFQSLSISMLSYLADRSCMAWSKLSNNIKGSQQQFEKKSFCKY